MTDESSRGPWPFRFHLLGFVLFISFAASVLGVLFLAGRWGMAKELAGHSGSVADVAASRDGRRMVTSANETIVWDLEAGKELIRIPFSARWIALSPDAKILIAAAELSRPPLPKETIAPCTTLVTAFRTSDGSAVFSLPKFNARICGPSFSSDGRLFATASEEGPVETWDAAAGKRIQAFATPKEAYTGIYPEGPRMVLFSKDSRRLGIAYIPAGKDWYPTWAVAVWDLDSGSEITDSMSHVEKWDLNPDSLNRSVWPGDGTLGSLPWDAINELEQIQFMGYWCNQAFILGDSVTGVTTHDDGMIRIWRRKYPDGLLGHLHRPEVRIALALGLLWFLRVAKYLWEWHARRLGKEGEKKDSKCP